MPRKKILPELGELLEPGINYIGGSRPYQARLRMSSTWTWTESYEQLVDAQAARAEKIVERRGNKRTKPSDITVPDLLAMWLRAKTGITDTSVERYTRSVAICSEAFTGLAVELGVAEIEEWMAERTGSPKTTNDVIGVVSQAYDMALRRSMAGFTMNPVRVAQKLKVHRDSRLATPLEHVHEIIEALPDHKRIAGHLAFEAGCRRAEIAGLRDVEVDYDRNQLHLNYQWRKRPRRGYGYEELKNHHRRTVPLPADSTLLARIREHLVAQGPTKTGAVLAGFDGRPISTQALTRTWQVARAAAGLPELDGWHVLRHAFGSWHLEHGENPANIAAWMGDTLETFTKHYGLRTGTAPTTNLGALAVQAGTQAREKRVKQVAGGGATVVDLGERRRNR